MATKHVEIATEDAVPSASAEFCTDMFDNCTLKAEITTATDMPLCFEDAAVSFRDDNFNPIIKKDVSLYRSSVRKLIHKQQTKLHLKREREPSRFPAKKLMQIFKKRHARKKLKSLIKKTFPHSSQIYGFANNYKIYFVLLNKQKDSFFSKYFCWNRKLKPFYLQRKYSDKGNVLFGRNASAFAFPELNKNSLASKLPELKGGMYTSNMICVSPWNILARKLATLGLFPLDVGGDGSCFFRACSHQMFGQPESHHEIRMAGINHLHNHPELYVESFSGDCWQSYISEMSQPQTWCDNLIIQAVSNALNCLIHITDSVDGSPAKVITPSFVTPNLERTVLFLGYINGLHYVSAIQQNSFPRKNTYFQNLKRKLLESNDAREMRLLRNSQNKKVRKQCETHEAKAERLAKQQEYIRSKRSCETPEARAKRLEMRREQYKLKKMTKHKQNIQSNEQTNDPLPVGRTVNPELEDCQETNDSFPVSANINPELHEMQSRDVSGIAVNNASIGNPPMSHSQCDEQQSYLKTFDVTIDGPLHEQPWAKSNMEKFHHSLEYSMNQCVICKEVWPLKGTIKSTKFYNCSRCQRDKHSPKAFSADNFMIPSQVPQVLQGLTQTEEMLIALIYK